MTCTVQAVIEDAFRGLFGRTLNFNAMVGAVGKLNQWYEEKGVLGQVRRGGAGGRVGVGGRGWAGMRVGWLRRAAPACPAHPPCPCPCPHTTHYLPPR